MALLRNIAGIEIYEGQTVGVVPTTTQQPPALFNSIIKLVNADGSAATGAAAAASDPVVMAVKAGINLLPPGDLKRWLSANPVKFWTMVIQLFTGRKYTTGEYRLGERFIDQVLHTNGPDTVKSYKDVPDNVVPQAQLMFTILFGVRITTDEDLWALSSGSSAYYARPDKMDIPPEAVERAVYLAQRYYPSSSFNIAEWNLDYFSQFPLAAPIPDPLTFGKLYSGPLPGGGTATNGVINVNAETPLSSLQQSPTGISTPGSNKGLLLLAALFVGGGLYYAHKRKMI